jgi:hypothetical protein
MCAYGLTNDAIEILAVLIAGGTWYYSWWLQRRQSLAEQRCALLEQFGILLDHFARLVTNNSSNHVPNDINARIVTLLARPTKMSRAEIEEIAGAIVFDESMTDQDNYHRVHEEYSKLRDRLRPELREILNRQFGLR